MRGSKRHPRVGDKMRFVGYGDAVIRWEGVDTETVWTISAVLNEGDSFGQYVCFNEDGSSKWSLEWWELSKEHNLYRFYEKLQGR